MTDRLEQLARELQLKLMPCDCAVCMAEDLPVILSALRTADKEAEQRVLNGVIQKVRGLKPFPYGTNPIYVCVRKLAVEELESLATKPRSEVDHE